jgi:regulator of sigma E protease
MVTNLLRDILAGAIVLGVLVLFHEWGHFLAAKLCGVRVEVFSIGFGPRLWGMKRGDTDYRISGLPLGGYVRMAGDNPVEGRTGAAYEFLSKPRWQRSIIVLAGPAINILVTFLIFWGIFAFAGMPVEPYVHQPADVAAVSQQSSGTPGVQAGDRILEVNGVRTATWRRAISQVEDAKPGDSMSLVVLRNGSRQTLTVRAPSSKSSADWVLGYPALPPVLEETSPNSPADKAGMKAGDTIISLNGKPVVTWPQMVEIVQASNGGVLHFVVRRDGKDVPLDITPVHMMNSDGQQAWMIGASRKTQEIYEHQGFIASVKDAGAETAFYTRLMGSIFAGLFNGKVSMHDLAGPVGIVQMSGQAAKGGLLTLLQWMAYISLDLGLLNLLPIPIFDGGHILMFVIEGTIRRDLSATFKERFVQVGLVFLLGLFAFVMYNDILRVGSGVWWK